LRARLVHGRDGHVRYAMRQLYLIEKLPFAPPEGD
jgi:hypothetical protein